MAQDRPLELVQLGRELQAELVVERGARGGERVERVGLPAGAVEREHELRTESLAKRLFADERLELGHELRVTALREVGLDPQLERLEPQLVETGGRRGDGLAREIGERWAAPERKRLAKQRSYLLGRRASRLVDEATEAFEVQLVRLDTEQVAGRPRDDPLAELSPQAEHVVLQRRLRAGGRLVVPDAVDQSLRRDDLVRVEQEQREHRAPLRPTERQSLLAVEDLERPEDPELHGSHENTGLRAGQGEEGERRRSPSAPSATRCRGWFRRWRSS